ncbi:hypothetical protein SAMN05444397_107227 [Flavobacterium aquidurense]|uniref:Uncharacterized protein n=1 Tax=Flavobacterium frigidimaris TaxID=262320 RepID=A0ABX4BX05_FLAFR|nr:hypothetical protein [Flavobacterium frigidimaris]OXA82462.1 hypothetical protein B0A65_00225 [Flavobacterium frigidimaris]SDZ48425.1 hypothetical protein SAMN05444397_107227 [Flavobacterium aquidurense]
MNSNLHIIDNKVKYYQLAEHYFQNIDLDEHERINFDEIIQKSISILLDHDFIPTPCIEIKLELLKDQKKIGNYFLYVNEKKEFIDEFLIT